MGYTIWPDGEMGEVLSDIHRERLRQEDLRAKGKFPATCATEGPYALKPPEKLAVLAEEFGECARHITEFVIDPGRLDPKKLREELIQIAAVAAAWAESLNRKTTLP